MKEAPDAIKLVRLKLIQIGWRRALAELKRRGYSEPTPLVRDNGLVLAKSSSEPGLLPGCEFNPLEDGTCPNARGIGFAAAQWTGEWGAWGWDAAGEYWGVDRKVLRGTALAEVALDFARNEYCEGFGGFRNVRNKRGKKL